MVLLSSALLLLFAAPAQTSLPAEPVAEERPPAAAEATTQPLPATQPADSGPTPLPDQPPQPSEPLPPPLQPPPKAVAQPDASAPPPDLPHPALEPEEVDGTVSPDRDNPPAGKRAPRRRLRVRTETTTEVCGMPVGRNAASPVLMVAAAAALLVALVTAAVALLFLLDLTQAQRMILAVDHAQGRDQARPDSCASWAGCRDRYLRAFYLDAAAVGGLALATVLMLLTAGGLLVAATVVRLG